MTSFNQKIFDQEYHHMKDDKNLNYFHNLNKIRFSIIEHYAKDKLSLDLGCGNGIHMIPLLKQGYNIEGLDYSQSLLNDLKTDYHGPIKLYLADILDTPFEDERFDFIYSISTLCYIPDQKKAIQEIYRILKPNGIAYLEFGNQNSLNNFESQRVSTGVQSIHISLNWLKKTLQEIGFHVFNKRFFQISPLYGSIVPHLLAQIMTTPYTYPGYQCMLDEAIASSEFLQQYAFRLCMFVSKLFIKNMDNPAIISGNVYNWTSERRQNIRSNLVVKEIRNQLQILCNLFKEDPTDALTFYALAKLHVQTEEEHNFVCQIKQNIDHYIQEKTCS